MSRYIVTVLFAGLLLAAAPAPKDDDQKLQGTWQLVAFEAGGTPAEEVDDQPFTVEKNAVVITGPTVEKEAATRDPDARPMELAVIGNPKQKEADILNAANRLGAVIEPAAFWTAIMRDESYSERHRRICAYMLFQRHIKPSMRLEKFGKRMLWIDWLKDDDIQHIVGLAGYIPIKNLHKGSVFRILLFPKIPGDKWAVYIRVSKKIDKAQFLAILRRKSADAVDGKVRIVEIGLSPDPIKLLEGMSR